MKVASFYRFLDIADPQVFRDELQAVCDERELLGTILVAGDDRQPVAEKAGQHGRPHQRVILPLVQDVDQNPHGEPAAADRRADDDVDRDPDAPRVAVAEIRHRGDALQKAHRDHDDP